MADIIYLPGKASLQALHRELDKIFSEIEIAKGYVASNYGHPDTNVRTRSHMALESLRKACHFAQTLITEVKCVTPPK